MFENKAVYLEWLDHTSVDQSGWKTPEDVRELEPTLIHSLGWVLKETDEYISIVGTLSADSDEVDGDVCIVKSCIVRREEVSFA